MDESRLALFARKQRPHNGIHPTQASLRANAKRVAYQAGIIWGHATIARLDISSPAEGVGVDVNEVWKHMGDLFDHISPNLL